MSKNFADEVSAGGEVYGFDAIKGIQSGQEYFVAMCPLKVIPKLFIFDDDDLPPKLKAQRTLRYARIPQIANYIVDNPKSYILSAITASVDGKMVFSPFPSLGEEGKIGRLYISMDSKLLINDGQHRHAAIKEALKQKPELGIETISVVFFKDTNLKKTQQMFSDLNQHAVKPTRSLAILYDHRNKFSQFIVELIDIVDVFHNRTELEKTSISNRSPELFTLNGIAEASRKILKTNNEPTKDEQKMIISFWNEVARNIPEWNLLMKGKITASNLRESYVHAHTNLLNALGMAGRVLMNNFPDTWNQKLKGLQKIDWSRDNPIWDGNLILNGKMIKNKTGIINAANEILVCCDAKSHRISLEERQIECKICV